MPIPLSVKVIYVVPCLLCRDCIVRERSCVLLVVFAQILSGGSLCGKSCVDVIVKILLCEGGDVELGARTSKHILVFTFDPLSLSLSLSYIVHCSYCSYHIHAWFDCVLILVFNQESFI